MFDAEFVILPNDSTLQQRPEAIDSVGVNIAIHIPDTVIDYPVINKLSQVDISLVIVLFVQT